MYVSKRPIQPILYIFRQYFYQVLPRAPSTTMHIKYYHASQLLPCISGTAMHIR